MPLWSGKKDDPTVPEPVDSGSSVKEPERLEDLTTRLSELGRQLAQTNDQVVNYLVHRESQQTSGGEGQTPAGLEKRLEALADKLDQLARAPAPGDQVSAASPAGGSFDAPALQAAMGAITQKLDLLEGQLRAFGQHNAGASNDAMAGGLAQLCDGMGAQLTALIEGVQQLHERLDLPLHYLADHLRPQEPDETQATPAGNSDWQRAILGSDLVGNTTLEYHRQQLLSGVLDGNPDAAALVGQLLVFRSAPTEKLPTLVKDLGEAYYRWQPKQRAGSGNNPMETALVAWITETLQDAGIPNSIELVHPGERFDSTRHTATSRGVEITAVRGWVVVRDNGRVYTKALVDVT